MQMQFPGDISDYSEIDDSLQTHLQDESMDTTPRPRIRGEALPLVSFDPDEGFLLNPLAVSIISRIPEPISVIAIAGKYRTGKSFLLNRVILDKDYGFGVGSTINPCTKGIQVWSKPLKGVQSDGTPCNVIVIDTEGIGALDETAEHDVKIFTLALLICSTFIYNSVGPIDENQIQNLAIVVNMTKSVQVKAGRANEEILSEYLPRFVWVTRDFSLKLVDHNGEAITPKEYLENALKPQKGFSNSIEQKNRIRKVLRHFFEDRECFMMVRPSDNEHDLQYLSTKNLSELRPEFAEQAMKLRQKLLSRVRVKVLGQQRISGEILVNLLQSYLESINSGAIPNIESAWTIASRTECEKSLQAAQILYNKVISSSISHRYPIDSKELQLIHKEAKSAALEHYQHKAIGRDALKIQNLLITLIKEQYHDIWQKNLIESQNKCKSFIEQKLEPLIQRLMANSSVDFQAFINELQFFQQEFLQNGPAGPNRKEVLLEFINQHLVQYAKWIIQQKNVELEKTQIKSDNVNTQLQAELDSVKQMLSSERSTWHEKLQQIEQDRAELKVKEKSSSESLAALLVQREDLEKELRSQIKNLHVDKKSIQDQLKESENQIKVMERQINYIQQEYNQEKDLLNQKIQFYESQSVDRQKRESELQNQIKKLKRDNSDSIKELNDQYEAQNKNLQQKLLYNIDKITKLEKALEVKDQQIQADSMDWSTKLQASMQQIEELNQNIEQLDNQLISCRKQAQTDLQTLQKQYENQISMLNRKLSTAEQNSQAYQTSVYNNTAQHDSEIALLNQKLEFLQQNLEEARQQLEEERKHHIQMLQSFQHPSENQKSLESKMQKLKESYEQELYKVTFNSNKTIKNLQAEISSLQGALSDLQLQNKLQINDWNQREQQYQKSISEGAKKRQELAEQASKLISQIENIRIDSEEPLKRKVKELERINDELNHKYNQDIHHLNMRADQAMSSLRNFYEQEKDRLEVRIQEERDKSNKMRTLTCEEYEERLRNEQEAREDEIEQLQEELFHQQCQADDEISRLTNLLNVQSLKIEALEQQIAELNQQKQGLITDYKETLEQQLERFDSEKHGFIEKIDSLSQSLSNKESELVAAEYLKEQLQEQIQKLYLELEQIKNQLKHESTIYKDKISKCQQQIEILQKDSQKYENDLKNLEAIKQHQVHDQQVKIEQMQKALNISEEQYTGKIQSLKAAQHQKLQNLQQEQDKIKYQYEQKLQDKKLRLKEVQSKFSRQIAQLEKENSQLSEQIQKLQIKIKEQTYQYQETIKKLEESIKEISTTQQDINLQQNYDNCLQQIYNLEQKLAKLKSDYKRDKVLWQNKIEFISQQRDQAKNDQQELKRNFDSAMDSLQQRCVSDKERLDSAHNQMIQSMEIRHNNQVNEMKTEFSQQEEILQQKIRQLEKSLQSSRDELDYYKKGSQNQSNHFNQELIELQNQLQMTQSNLEIERKSREKRRKDLETQFEDERQKLRKIIHDLEKRNKELDEQKQNQFFQLERDKSRWLFEKDQLLTQQREYMDNIKRLEAKQQSLMKQIDYARQRSTSRNRNGQGALTRNNSFSISFEERSRTPTAHSTTGEASPKNRIFTRRQVIPKYP